MSMGEKIAKYRQEVRLTRAQLAKMSGINKDYLKAIESGKRVPHVKTLARIAECLGVGLDLLLGEEDK